MDVLRLTLRQLQIFVAVARCGSTTAAGEQLALSQSATSAAINELERLLSLRLFDRIGRRLSLNGNGRALLPRALALLDEAAALARVVRDADAQVASVRVGASTTIGNYALPALWARYLGPAIATGKPWQSRVMIANTAAVCEAVERFDIDVGLIEGPCHLPSLDVQPWVRDELVLVAAPDSEAGRLIQGRHRLGLRALREQLWLLREPGSGTREVTDQWLLPSLHRYRRSIEMDSSEAIKRVVAQGVGIACLSAWAVSDFMSSGRLLRLATTLPPLFRQCHLVTHPSRQRTAALDAFIDEALRHGATMR